MDQRLNPDNDFVFSEDRLMENTVDTIRKLPIYATNYATCKTNAEVAEQQLKNIESAVELEVRSLKTDDKLTEGKVRTLVNNHTLVQQQQKELTQARAQLYYAEGYWRAIQKACDLLQMMGYSRNAEMKRI